ncbi:MAG TPA: glycosyltransferase family 4 protein [Gemmatimonadales bacterium]
MRAVLLSRAYADPANRGKLKAIAGLGPAVAAAAPDRWVPNGLQREQQTSFGDDGGVRIIPVPIGGSARRGGNPRWNARALRRLLADFKPDIVQIEEEPWTRGAATLARLARRQGIPYVVLTNESLPGNRSWVTKFRRSRVLNSAAGVIAVNELAARLVLRHHPNLKHRVVSQLGVPLPLAVPRNPHQGLCIGFLARLIPEKGLDLLFRACVKLVGRWTILVVGTGPAQEELEALAERLGIAGRVTWLGALPRPAVEEIWPRLDCVVLPSRSAPQWVEATPRAALDAMAHGVAVVGSASGALPGTLGDAGIVVPEEDVSAITDALQRLHDSPAEHQRLGAAGRRRVMDEFTDAAIAQKTVQFWRELTNATA